MPAAAPRRGSPGALLAHYVVTASLRVVVISCHAEVGEAEVFVMAGPSIGRSSGQVGRGYSRRSQASLAVRSALLAAQWEQLL